MHIFIKNIMLSLTSTLLFSFSVFSQDTLIYEFLPENHNTPFFPSKQVCLYTFDDSSFIIENLFPSKGDHDFRFKISGPKWFLKYDSDWMLFFSQGTDSHGSWKITNFDMIVEWSSTTLLDNQDTVYLFRFSPLHNESNPLQMGNGVEVVVSFIDGMGPYYFTLSSGVIAFKNDLDNLYIRKDKMYLEKNIKEPR